MTFTQTEVIFASMNPDRRIAGLTPFCCFPRPKVIEAGFVVSFFLGKVLSHSITGAVALRRGSAARTGGEELTERQLEDAVTPHLTRSRELYFVFKERKNESPMGYRVKDIEASHLSVHPNASDLDP
jgi:hypothetical protein